MESFVYALAIIGCSDAGSGCTTLRTPAIRYPTAAACHEAAPDALMASTDLDFPMLRAKCRRERTSARAAHLAFKR